MKYSNVPGFKSLDRFNFSLIEVGFYLVLAAYAVVMIYYTPGDERGLFPRIILPVLMLLLFVKLFQLASPNRYDAFAQKAIEFTPEIQFLQEDEDLASKVSESDDETPDKSRSERIILVIGSLSGIVIVYFLGLVLGGIVFIFAFTYYYNRNLLQSLAVSIGIMLFIYGITTLFDLRVWEGALFT